MTFSWEATTGSSVEECPLAELFLKCMLVHNHVSELPSSRSDAQRFLDWAIEALKRCDAVADSTGVFSDNEDKDDIATEHLRYLLIPYLLAELTAQTRDIDPLPRLTALSGACRHYTRFLNRCRDFELVDEGTRRALDRADAGEEVDPRIARTEKIERKRKEMSVESRIQELLQEQSRAAAREADAAETWLAGAMDEESERELWVLNIEHACMRSVDQLRCLTQEQELLLHMARRQRDTPDEETLERERSARIEEEEQKAIMKAKLMQIAAEVTHGRQDRQQAAAEVFRPSHILPTYTVEQAGMIELKQAQEREERSKAAEAARLTRIAETDKEVLEEEAIQKQRAWDDWVDDHPAGYGNSKLRPCAL